MRSLYGHYRAPHLWSRGKTAADPNALTECIEGLEKYGYHEHAAELRIRLADMLPKAETVTVTEPAKPKAKRSRKKAES